MIIKLFKSIRIEKGKSRKFELTDSSNPMTTDKIRRENIRLRLLKQNKYIDEECIL